MPKFINKDQLDKLAKSLNSKSKAAVSEEEQRAQAAEQALQTEIETTRDMFGGKSIVYITQAEYDSLSEKEQNDNTKAYFIIDAEDLSHEHNNKDLLDNFGARNITIGNSSKTFDGSKNISYTLSDIGAAESGHTHDDRYYTESEVNTKLSDLQTEVSADIKAEENRAKAAETSLQTAIDGKADTSHGNHVPKTQTANNAIFLRCDNTWATVTPDNIGAAAASHGTHVTYSTTVPKANGTATVGSEASVARGDHVHPVQTSVSGNAGTATALKNARTITIGNQSNSFDGTENISYSVADIGAAPASHNHDGRYYTEAEVDVKIGNLQSEIDSDVKVETDRAMEVEAELQAAIGGKANASHNHNDLYYTESEMNTKLAAKADKEHDHDDDYYTQTEIDGKIETINTAINGKANASHGNHVPTTETANNARFLRNDNTWATITPGNIGAAKESHGTHVTWSTTVPKANGTASIGNETKVARGDHVHPLQTSVEKLTTARTITIGNQGIDFDGSANIDFTLGDIGAAAAGHNHDERYYTEAEINTKVTNLQAEIDADVKVEADRAKKAEAALEAAIGGKAASGHTHDDRYFTETEVTNKLATKSDIGHDHDDDYYTETEIDGKIETLETAIDGKANASHGNHVPATQTADNKVFLRNDNTWATITPENIGAAKSSHGTHVTWATNAPKAPAETAAVGSVDRVAREDHVHPLQETITGNAGSADTLSTARTITIGEKGLEFDGSENLTYTLAEIGAAAASHSHDGRYYTESEINTKVTNLQKEIDADVKAEADRAKEVEQSLQAAIGGKANASHGNHVPTTQTASNKVFLRNDNTWATVTPANIGAAASSHTHDDRYFTETEINSKITTINTAISNAQTAAQNYADTKIAALVDSAPDALNTLNELATAITDHKDVYDAYVEKMDAKLASKSDTSHTHKYAGSSSAGGAATSANKVNSNLVVKLNSGSTEGTNLFTFNGSAAKTINITPDNIGAAKYSHGIHVDYASAAPKENGTAAVGSSSKVAREDHVHPLQTTISGNAGSADTLSAPRTITIGNKGLEFDGSENLTYTLSDIGAAASGHTHKYAGSSSAGGAANKVANSIKVQLNGGTTEGTNQFTFDGSAAKTINITASSIGAVGSNHGTHVTYSTTVPKVAGTASAGSESAVARGDHVHPAQTSVSGNAGTATKLATARTIIIGNKGQTFDGSDNITYTLSDIGAAASSHTHGLLHDNLTCTVENTETDNGWSMINSSYGGFLLKSIRTNASTPNWICNNYSAGIAFGGADTKGIISTAYNAPSIKFAGGNGNKPVWWIGLTGTSGTSYNLANFENKNHGTHVTYSTSAPLVAGTASVGSAANVARGDHVHPAQTSVSGNAGTATKLAAARSITIGNKANNFDGSGNISYSLAEIGAAPIQTKSAATAATAQWYRIATSAASINNCLGLFEIEAAASGKHSVTLVSAGISYGVTNGVNLQQLSHTMHSATGISKARIVYHTTYNSNYAYLEVYLPSATATTITVNLVGGRGWTLVTPSTVGSIPSGYTNKEITFQANKIVSNVQGSVSGNAGTATKLASKRTITIGNQGKDFDGSGNISFDLATIGAAATSHNHTSLTGITSLAFKTEGSDSASISTSIDSSNTYFDFNLSDDSTQNDMWRWRFSPSGGTVFNAMTLDPTSTTAAKLSVTGEVTATLFTENGTALSSKYAAKSHGTHVGDAYATATPKANGTAAVGTSSKIAREDHVHPLQTTVSGNAGSADKLSTARTITIGKKSNSFDGSANISYSIADIGAAPASHTHNYAGSSSPGGAANSVKTNLIIKLNGGSTEGTNLFTFNGGTAKTVNITPSAIGAAESSHGEHVIWSTTAPKVAGTAAVGSETTVARGDHVHAAQTSVSGNAGTATKWKNAITLTIGNKGKSVDGSDNVKWTLTEIGASPLQKSVVSKGTKDGKLTLTTDRYQKATLVTGNEIVLPTVSDFCEINLFVKDCSLANVILPDNCKWRVDPNLVTGTSFIMTFIYTTQEWLAEIKVYS